MSRDGQGAQDYGVHLVPEADWASLGECGLCGATAGHACRDLRARHVPAGRLWTAHKGRQLSDGQPGGSGSTQEGPAR